MAARMVRAVGSSLPSSFNGDGRLFGLNLFLMTAFMCLGALMAGRMARSIWVTNTLWAKVGAIGKRLWFRWGGEFHSIKDRPHFEWSGGLSLAQLRAGERPFLSISPARMTFANGEKP